MRIMGLDFGAKTVGVAISDPLLITAQGIEIIRRKEENKLRRTLARIEGTNLYDAVVENINGGLAKVAELLGRNEAELAAAAVPAEAGNKSKEHEAFDMNDFL